MPLRVPSEIEEALARFSREMLPTTPLELSSELGALRRALVIPTADVNEGAWSEVAAFTFRPEGRPGSGPWPTYFVPIGSQKNRDGSAVLWWPDPQDITAEILDHWAARAAAIAHPVLRARYADLCWDFARHVDRRRRNPEYARIAIEAYLQANAQALIHPFHDRMIDTRRALDLACALNDRETIIRARDALLALHEVAVAGEGFWHISFDRLIEERKCELTDQDKLKLVTSLEQLFNKASDTGNPSQFDPHLAQALSRRLIRFYTRASTPAEPARINAEVGRAFEHLAAIAEALAASAHLQTAENAYREARMPEDARRVRNARIEAGARSRDEMQVMHFSQEIKKEDLEAFTADLIREKWPDTLFGIARAFVTRVDQIESQLRELAKESPLYAMIPIELISEGGVSTRVGSIEDDMEGRSLHEGTRFLSVDALFLDRSLKYAVDAHELNAHQLTAFIDRAALFDDLSFIYEGVKAWFDLDFTKTVFVLTPQIERGLRALSGKLGMPVTKAHPTMPGRQIATNLGDILPSQEFKDALGPDLIFYFKLLFYDPRGLNLRNNVAHGLFTYQDASSHNADLLIHALLVLACWKELAPAAAQGPQT